VSVKLYAAAADSDGEHLPRISSKQFSRSSSVSAGDKLQPGEVARFTNAAARLIDVYSNAAGSFRS
jgi:hypothetical protein